MSFSFVVGLESIVAELTTIRLSGLVKSRIRGMRKRLRDGKYAALLE